MPLAQGDSEGRIIPKAKRFLLVGTLSLLRGHPTGTFAMWHSPWLYLYGVFSDSAAADVSLVFHEQIIKLIKDPTEGLAGASAPLILNFFQLRVWSGNRSH